MPTAKNFILDLLFPRHCLGCSLLITDFSDNQLCPACQATIPFKSEFICAFCGSPVVLGRTCQFCRKNYQLDRLWVATVYETPLVEKMIKTIKYRFVKSLTTNVSEIMIKYLDKKVLPSTEFNPSALLVTAVPLHKRRLNWRGFNQSDIFAQNISQHFNWPFSLELLKRNRYKKPQAEIENRLERLKNMENVFQCLKPDQVRNRKVIVVDDISTTGSTLNDCARALKGAGATEVIGLVFARNR